MNPPGFLHSLSSRLLLLTIAFVAVVELLVLVPTISQFRTSYLAQRIAAAQIAALAVEEVPNRRISPELESDLLYSAEVQAVAVLQGDAHMLVLRQDLPDSLAGQYDLATESFWDRVKGTYQTLMRGGKGSIRVRGASTTNRYNWVEVVMRENELYDALRSYSANILSVGLLIAAIGSVLIYFSLHRLVARPMRSLTENISRFREAPEDSGRLLEPSERHDEIGAVEQELARAQRELRQSLQQKTRLANLGSAVSRINHDLRNILSTAQISSDRLLEISDPQLRSVGPRLVRSVNRAIALCERTLKYGKAEEPPPHKIEIGLHALVDDVAASLDVESAERPLWQNAVADDATIYGDPDQIYRVLLNLGRNAINAINGEGRIEVRSARQNGADIIWMEDSGGGLPKDVQEHLFEPFAKGRGKGSTGLGLTIVKELMASHGGDVIVERSDDSGTVFRLTLPVAETGR